MTLPERCYGEDFVNYYKLLCVTRRASAAEIRGAFRRRAYEAHPDRNKEESAADLFKLYKEAIDVLDDIPLRHEYDGLLEDKDVIPRDFFRKDVHWETPKMPQPYMENEAFKVSLARDSAASTPAENVKFEFITLEDVMIGKTLDSGIKVPPGVKDRTRIVSGDVYVIRVLPHDRFIRGGKGSFPNTTENDLISFSTISPDNVAKSFARGSIIDLEGNRRLWNISGKEADLVFDSAKSLDSQKRPYVRIPGAGLPCVSTKRKGDIIIEVSIYQESKPAKTLAKKTLEW